jgi:hypothetical protein
MPIPRRIRHRLAAFCSQKPRKPEAQTARQRGPDALICPFTQFSYAIVKCTHLSTYNQLRTLIMLDPAIPANEQVFQIFDILCGQRVPSLDIFRQGALHVKRAMFRYDLICRAIACIEINGNTLAGEMLLVLGQIDFRKAVPRVLIGLEYECAVKIRRERTDAIIIRVSWVGMEFDRAAPLHLPPLVQINQQIEPAMELGRRIIVEIDMSIEFLPMPIFVGAPAIHIGVGEKIGNPGQVAHQLEELSGFEISVKPRIGRAYFRDRLVDRLAPDFAKFVHRFLPVENRKIREERLGEGRVEEIFDYQMLERLGAFKLLLVSPDVSLIDVGNLRLAGRSRLGRQVRIQHVTFPFRRVLQSCRWVAGTGARNPNWPTASRKYATGYDIPKQASHGNLQKQSGIGQLR